MVEAITSASVPPKTEIAICNSALIKVGAARISAFDDGSEEALACTEHYTRLRDDLQRRHIWNFAVGRQKLARLSATPVYEFDYAFQMPADWLRTLSVHDNESGLGTVPYRIEGRTILTGADQLWLRYVRRIDDPDKMTALFRELFALYMARDLSLVLAKSNQIRNIMEKRFRDALKKASSVDAIEDYPEDFPESLWTSVRHGDLDWPYRN